MSWQFLQSTFWHFASRWENHSRWWGRDRASISMHLHHWGRRQTICRNIGTKTEPSKEPFSFLLLCQRSIFRMLCLLSINRILLVWQTHINGCSKVQKQAAVSWQALIIYTSPAMHVQISTLLCIAIPIYPSISIVFGGQVSVTQTSFVSYDLLVMRKTQTGMWQHFQRAVNNHNQNWEDQSSIYL